MEKRFSTLAATALFVGVIAGCGTGDPGVDSTRQGIAEKITICHATGSETNPYVQITISVNAIPNAHDVHQIDQDIIPAPEGGCPGVTQCVKDTDCPDKEVCRDGGCVGNDS